MDHSPFNGAKLLLTQRGMMLTYLRDDFAHLPYPSHWDLPGGGREGHETPIECALRELDEEFSLNLSADRLTGREFPSAHQPGAVSWLFIGQLTRAEITTIQFGNEGQRWCMMPITDYLRHPQAIPHFQRWIRHVL
ncbi:NUDIX hydrolase [Paracoccus sp. 11-3]|uniref:NUDIX hydrolase n=1 Tax=Paracoccus amoyensis TaxID=2760093 RepID=A0A926J5M6_9RHOB|nr:NUDIX hydrolase [Paracoccus amoyensis]MBC9246382.1 NUDIX hydrolase [Paracoccus amoyensis]